MFSSAEGAPSVAMPAQLDPVSGGAQGGRGGPGGVAKDQRWGHRGQANHLPQRTTIQQQVHRGWLHPATASHRVGKQKTEGGTRAPGLHLPLWLILPMAGDSGKCGSPPDPGPPAHHTQGRRGGRLPRKQHQRSRHAGLGDAAVLFWAKVCVGGEEDGGGARQPCVLLRRCAVRWRERGGRGLHLLPGAEGGSPAAHVGGDAAADPGRPGRCSLGLHGVRLRRGQPLHRLRDSGYPCHHCQVLLHR